MYRNLDNLTHAKNLAGYTGQGQFGLIEYSAVKRAQGFIDIRLGFGRRFRHQQSQWFFHNFGERQADNQQGKVERQMGVYQILAWAKAVKN